jgi:hypothetical protein
MRRLLILLAFAAVSSPVLAAADLDMPLKPAVSTLRSEILRGSEATRACEARANPAKALEAYARCVDAIHEQNRNAMGSRFEAFDVGLYFRERQTLQILLRQPGGSPVTSTGTLSIEFALADSSYALARDKLGLTEAEAADAAP